MTPKQLLLEHLRDLHPSQSVKLPKRQTLKQLQSWHASQHHRYHCNHHHGPTAGVHDRPIGWRTGENAVPITRRSLR